MKLIKNLPVYVLSGALIFVGVASATQAQAAWTSKESNRIKALESKIQKLESAFASAQDSVSELSSRISVLQSSQGNLNNPDLSTFTEVRLDFLREVGLINTCPKGTSVAGGFSAKQYPIGQDSSGFPAKMISCAATVLVKK